MDSPRCHNESDVTCCAQVEQVELCGAELYGAELCGVQLCRAHSPQPEVPRLEALPGAQPRCHQHGPPAHRAVPLGSSPLLPQL